MPTTKTNEHVPSRQDHRTERVRRDVATIDAPVGTTFVRSSSVQKLNGRDR